MAVPTIDEIKQSILAKKAEYASLDALNSTSKVAIYNLWAYIVATVIWILYQFHELYRQETDEKIKAQKIYSLLWFRDKALDYRHGHPLEKQGYDLIYTGEGYTEEQILESLVVKRAAVIELELGNRIYLFVKCATVVNGGLAKLTDGQKEGLTEYFGRIKPAGTKLEVFSEKADELKLWVDFFYDPQVLTDQGARIDGTDNEPVQKAIRNYLTNLRFNGEFSVSELQDILQALPECADREAYITMAQANFQNPAAWTLVPDFYVANSGYMSVEDQDLNIDFKPKTVLL